MADSLDETETFQPRYDSEGLIPAIVTDSSDGTVLMFAHMNAEALRLTLDTGYAHFWSRSRQKDSPRDSAAPVSCCRCQTAKSAYWSD